MFRGSDQQDAHELLMFLMEYLNQDVNEIRCKVKLPEQNNDNIPEMEAAKRAWEMEQKADRSFIRQTFYGQQRSTLRYMIYLILNEQENFVKTFSLIC